METDNKDLSHIDELLKDAAALKKVTKMLRKGHVAYTKDQALHHKAAEKRRKRKRGGHK